MTKEEEEQLLKIINSIDYGSIEINKQAGKIVNIVKKESIKLEN